MIFKIYQLSASQPSPFFLPPAPMGLSPSKPPDADIVVSSNAPPPPVIAPVPHGPPMLCSAAVQHAAADHTQLYLNLLPLELRTLVDTLCSWRHLGLLRPVNLPPTIGAYGLAHALDVGGEEVVVLAGVEDTFIVRLRRNPKDPHHTITIRGILGHVDVSGAPSRHTHTHDST